MDNPPLLYYRSPGQIEEYRSMPALQKIRKLEMEMEFLYYIRAEKAKRIRGRVKEK
jgi:hypothetical protein